MKTTTVLPTPATGVILALDLGKYKSVACRYAPDSGAVQFRTVASDRDEFRRLIQRQRPAVVVIEACTPAGWVHDLCGELGVPCRVANTASEAWKFKHSKRKTDRDDALRLAELEALGQLPTVTIPTKPVRERRALIATRQALVTRRVAVQNRIRAILLGQGLAAPVGHRAWTEAGRAALGHLAKPLAQCAAEGLWRGLLDLALTELGQIEALVSVTEAKLDALAQADPATKLLRTVPGVGPRTAETIAASLADATRFRTGKQVSAYAGLVPRQYQSGEMDRRGRITKRGPAVLRKLLVECAWAMLRYNAWARATWMRLTKNGTTRKKPAIVALARRLLVRCWAMLRDGTPWRGDPAPAVALARST
jgi:transposase